MINRMKKIISGMTVLMFLFVLVASSGAYAAEFSDISKEHANYPAIMGLVSMGAIAGYEDGTFMPEREITRTEFCAVLARTMGYKKEGYQKKNVPFSDVVDGYWGEDFISFCYERDLINGIGGGLFAPADKVTYEQIIKMLVCAVKKQNVALEHSGEKWYSGYAVAAEMYGLLYNTNVKYGYNAPRAAVAQMVYNAVESGLLSTILDTSSGDNEQIVIENDSQGNGGDLPTQTGGNDNSNAATDSSSDENAYQQYLDELKKYYAAKNPRKVKTVLIDAGHNYDGYDRGAENKELGIHEEDITFAIADKLRHHLEQNGYKVVMTRETRESSIANTSEKSSLTARVDLAHETCADLFISIHCNMGGGKGAETYCFSMNGESAALAELVQKNIASGTELYNRGVKTAGFFVIKNTLMPAILIESGFMDNESDILFLNSESGQEAIAAAIADAVYEYSSETAVAEYENKKTGLAAENP